MILIADTITPRLRYISAFIGEQLTGQPLLLTTDPVYYSQYNGTRINYTANRIATPELQLVPHPLLFETGIHEQAVEVEGTKEHTRFFTTTGDFPFDVFAASFYLLSRYEEYLPHREDIYGRYAHENSLAWRHDFLQLPLINYWLTDLQKKIRKQFPQQDFSVNSFRFLPTYDIDEAYSFRYKGWYRGAGGWLKDVFSGNSSRAALRLQVLNKKEQDPFDSFDRIDEINNRYGLHPCYFFLLAKENRLYDKNISPGHPVMKALVCRHAGKYKTGIHPSWQSGDADHVLAQELDTFFRLTGKKAFCSRQHFIRFSLPAGYRRLLANGITEDYSMGYGSINGFRASVATPFYWYDLEKETGTSLLLYPFCFMEANSFYELRQSPAEALGEMMHYYEVTREVKGMLSMIWHNTFLGTADQFKGWAEVYEQFLQQMQADRMLP